MRGSLAIRAADVQRLLNMVIDVCTSAASPLQRKRSLIAALCKTFNARIGEIVEIAEGPAPGHRQLVSFVDHGWDHLEQGRQYAQRSEQLNLSDPLSESILSRADESFNLRREDAVADPAWYESAYVNEVLRPADLDSILGCYRRFRITPLPAPALVHAHARATCLTAVSESTPSDPSGCEHADSATAHTHAHPRAHAHPAHHSRIVGIGVGLHRPWSEPAFTQRDVALLSHFNNALVRLYPSILFDEDEHVWRSLSTRLREVLDLLLEGLADKDIAERLRLSHYTIHDYAAELYKRFNVEGRTALLAKILGRTRTA